MPAIEESIFAGVPINVTLLFSREQYLAAAEAYLRGIERRIAAGLDPKVESVASLFVSRWDVAVKEELSPQYRNRLGIAIAMRTYKAYRDLLGLGALAASSRQAGAHPQRLLWASTGTKDPARPTRSTSKRSRRPTRSTRCRKRRCRRSPTTARSARRLPVDGGNAEAVLEEFRREGVDDEALAARLQREGADAFAKSWRALLSRIAEKSRNWSGSRPSDPTA